MNTAVVYVVLMLVNHAADALERDVYVLGMYAGS